MTICQPLTSTVPPSTTLKIQLFFHIHKLFLKKLLTIGQKKPTMRRPNLMAGGSDEHFKDRRVVRPPFEYHRKPLTDG